MTELLGSLLGWFAYVCAAWVVVFLLAAGTLAMLNNYQRRRSKSRNRRAYETVKRKRG